jgi:hypothetical protein
MRSQRQIFWEEPERRIVVKSKCHWRTLSHTFKEYCSSCYLIISQHRRRPEINYYRKQKENIFIQKNSLSEIFHNKNIIPFYHFQGFVWCQIKVYFEKRLYSGWIIDQMIIKDFRFLFYCCWQHIQYCPQFEYNLFWISFGMAFVLSSIATFRLLCWYFRMYAYYPIHSFIMFASAFLYLLFRDISCVKIIIIKLESHSSGKIIFILFPWFSLFFFWCINQMKIL